MTKRDLLSVAIRVIGLVLLIRAVEQLAIGMYSNVVWGSQAVQGFDRTLNLVYTVASAAFYAIASLVFLLIPESIARLLVADSENRPLPDVSRGPRSWFAVAARIVGLVLLGFGIPWLIAIVAQAFATTTIDTSGYALIDRFGVLFQNLRAAKLDAAAYRALAQILIGAYLLCGAEHFGRLMMPKKRPVKNETAHDDEQ